ncbi:MAG: hypothetical protein GXY25_00465 [Pirellulaceae bacterium]|nr:hypothetical protein [Thermoguttaceae bacterium]NLY98989.1 hypothetical protein [Pirellulaceae bacterium]
MLREATHDDPPRLGGRRAGVPASRRQFLEAASRLAAVAACLDIGRAAHASGDDILKVGLIGCGGRGTGAAVNALSADARARLVAVADAFPWRIEESLPRLSAEKPGQVSVDADHRFAGLQSYRPLLESGVDVVLIAVPGATRFY